MKIVMRTSDRRTASRRAYDFMSKHRAAALSTVSPSGVPHSAIVYCIAEKDLSLYFSTRVEGRKFINLLSQPIVSMAFSDEETLSTIQLTGVAERVVDLNVEQRILRSLLLLRWETPHWPVPPIKLFEARETDELAIMKVTPQEMTSGNFETTPTGKLTPFFEKVI